ncbi:hypothetical protein R6Q59_013968 [Mikania micrantha]
MLRGTPTDFKNLSQAICLFIGNRDSQLLLDLLRDRVPNVPEFYFDFSVVKGYFRHIFWADDIFKKKNEVFGDVLHLMIRTILTRSEGKMKRNITHILVEIERLPRRVPVSDLCHFINIVILVYCFHCKKQNDATIKGQARFFELLHAGLNSAALRCALKLNIADIINSHNGPMTLSQIAQEIGSPSLNIGGLSRLMRFLVYKQVFDEVHDPGHEETLFALNECSKLLVKDAKNTLAPIAMSFIDPLMAAPFYNLNKAIEERVTAAFKTYGVKI